MEGPRASGASGGKGCSLGKRLRTPRGAAPGVSSTVVVLMAAAEAFKLLPVVRWFVVTVVVVAAVALTIIRNSC